MQWKVLLDGSNAYSALYSPGPGSGAQLQGFGFLIVYYVSIGTCSIMKRARIFNIYILHIVKKRSIQKKKKSTNYVRTEVNP
jgi:hypothetical protein